MIAPNKTDELQKAWLEFDQKVHSLVNNEKVKRHKRLFTKLKKIKNNSSTSTQVYQAKAKIENFVIFKSELTFDEIENLILNKGLHFALPPKQSPKKEIVVDVIKGIRGLQPYDKQ